MITLLLSARLHQRVGAVATLAILALVTQPANVAAQGVPIGPLATTYPVVVKAQGHLADIFFSPGERVKRGQLLAKVELANGSAYYVNAPVAGRVAAARLQPGYYLPARTVLTTVEVLSAPVH